MPLSPESVALLKANNKAMPQAMSDMPIAPLRELMKKTAVKSTTDIFKSVDVSAPTRAGSVTVR